MLSDEIDDAPTAVALLDMRKCEPCHFRTAQSASEKDGEDGTIAKSDGRRDVRLAQKRLRLPLGKPVSNANATDPFD